MNNYVKFEYFAGITPIIIAAQIREIRNVKRYGSNKCRVYLEITYNPLTDELYAINDKGIVDIEEAKNLLKKHLFVEANADYTNIENRYNFDKIKEINPPEGWYKSYYEHKTFEG